MDQLPALKFTVYRLLADLLHEGISVGAEEVIEQELGFFVFFVDG